MKVNNYLSINELYKKILFPTNYEKFENLIDEEGSFLKINQLISFQNLEFGEDLRSVEKKMGVPRYVVNRANYIAPIIYFYKEFVLNHEIIIQLFFYDNKFVFATQTIFDESKEWKEFIMQVVYEKYNNKNTSVVRDKNISEMFFMDQQSNKIILLNSVNLNILYVAGQKNLINLIKDFNQSFKSKSEKDFEQFKKIVFDKF